MCPEKYHHLQKVWPFGQGMGSFVFLKNIALNFALSSEASPLMKWFSFLKFVVHRGLG